MKKSSRIRLWIALVIVFAAGIGAAAWALVPRVALADHQVPTAKVARGDLEVNLNLSGDLLTGKSVTVAPPPAGVPLRLMKIVETGDVVHAGDVVMAFDPADQEYIVDVNKSQLLEAEQEIIKQRANSE